jgi:outer membrane protein
MSIVRPIFVFLLALSALGVRAQEHQKVGYADWNYIFGAMPEFKQIDTQLKSHGELLQAQVEAKTKDLEEKMTAYQALPPNTADLIRADKQEELQRLDEGLRKFQEDAQRSYELKRQQLMDPVFAKVGKAIEDVAKENGYSFIFNPQFMTGGDILLFTDPKFDISDLVLKKLGVAPPPKTPPTKP